MSRLRSGLEIAGRKTTAMDSKHLEFLIDLLMHKVLTVTGVDDCSTFILQYRLTEEQAVEIMDEVNNIDQEVKQVGEITYTNVLERIGRFYKPGMGGTGGPVMFVSQAFQTLAPGL